MDAGESFPRRGLSILAVGHMDTTYTCAKTPTLLPEIRLIPENPHPITLPPQRLKADIPRGDCTEEEERNDVPFISFSFNGLLLVFTSQIHNIQGRQCCEKQRIG